MFGWLKKNHGNNYPEKRFKILPIRLFKSEKGVLELSLQAIITSDDLSETYTGWKIGDLLKQTNDVWLSEEKHRKHYDMLSPWTNQQETVKKEKIYNLSIE